MYLASSLLLLASLVAAADPRVAAAAQVITANYDALETDPNFLGGQGSPIPNPYKRLSYNSKVTVIALKEELLAGLTPPSGDNCIQVTNVKKFYYNPLFSKISTDDNFTLRGFSFACGYDLLEEAEPIACRLQISCLQQSLSGSTSDKFYNYTGTSDFQAVNAKLTNLGSCGFAIHSAGADGKYDLPITVFFDDFRYSTVAKK